MSEKLPEYDGPSRSTWVDDAIELTEAWIQYADAEARVELAFSAPGDWDYDFSIDRIRQVKLARKTLEALKAERELIAQCAESIKRDTEEGKYDHEP